VDSLLDCLNPLVDLLNHAPDPTGFAAQLLAATTPGDTGTGAGAAGAAAGSAEQVWQVCTQHLSEPALIGPVLSFAEILAGPARSAPLTDVARLRASAAQALLAARQADRWELVLTVPGFLRERLDALAGLAGSARPRQTATVLTDVAASATAELIIAAPYLHTGFVQFLVEPVTRLLERGGTVLVLTRALSLRAPKASSANVEAVEMLSTAGAGAPSRLCVCSWEARGLGCTSRPWSPTAAALTSARATSPPAARSATPKAGCCSTATASQRLTAGCVQLPTSSTTAGCPEPEPMSELMSEPTVWPMRYTCPALAGRMAQSRRICHSGGLPSRSQSRSAQCLVPHFTPGRTDQHRSVRHRSFQPRRPSHPHAAEGRPQ
jgi:hypothetical protein